MDTKNFVLSYYKNSLRDFHIHKVEKSVEAQKPHTHEYFQIYYITKGSLMHYVESHSSLLHQGDMFIIPPETIHRITPKEDTVFYSFSFMPDFLGEAGKNNMLAHKFIQNLQSDKNIRPKVSLDDKDIFYVETIMDKMLREFKERPLGFYEVIHSHTVLLVTILARNYFEKEKSGLTEYFESNKQFVLHCVKYIEANFTEKISLDDISKRSAMSKSSFCSLFSEITGHSFNSYLNICRIKKASEYIKNGYKITALYGLCGYSDFSTFYRNFKKVKGLSPQEYKKSL